MIVLDGGLFGFLALFRLDQNQLRGQTKQATRQSADQLIS
jgi:hypothetical protein